MSEGFVFTNINFVAKMIIVDENNNVVSTKERNTVGPGDIYRVTALWLTNSTGEILMAQRSLQKKNDPGRWGPAVSGTVEEGEECDENIIREAKEEIGLELSPDKLSKGPILRMRGEANEFFGQWYKYSIDKPIGEFTVQKNEVEKVCWFTTEELQKKFELGPNEFIHSTKQWLSYFLP